MTEMPAEPRVRVFQDPDAVARAAANEFARLAAARAEAAGTFNVALSGGSTPRRLFTLLAGEPYAGQVPWTHVQFFWGDERTVPPGHPDSNYGMAREALLSRVPSPAANVHRIQGELDPDEAARAYESEIRHCFQLGAEQLPRFDLALLGMGADGHTASLFPGSPALREQRRLVVAPWVEKLETRRVTLTCPVFNNAAFILFLVTGADKAETLRAVLEGPGDRYPAQLIRPAQGELYWYIDSAAGRLLEGGGR
ncbi:MAG TPA: 6-phosphogluconolactonase [Gemmatimonadota bacterium]|nr:6-phosphogluconolactonase [Gemmatimonadota bacterium]